MQTKIEVEQKKNEIIIPLYVNYIMKSWFRLQTRRKKYLHKRELVRQGVKKGNEKKWMNESKKKKRKG